MNKQQPHKRPNEPGALRQGFEVITSVPSTVSKQLLTVTGDDQMAAMKAPQVLSLWVGSEQLKAEHAWNARQRLHRAHRRASPAIYRA